ncbi:Alpha/beta hydrolase family protein [Lacunisphaera limnophila]|uniref:Alpha/beta hydrolase family protein n=2 Tax=Lacunisphaera limnophila TaxID=1838286 RepID=A0A1D8AZH4_9BACT|nr:Alpha/beta hydrolase family protein [Lacunisphaera limnophila]
MRKMPELLSSVGRILLLLAGLYVVCAVGAHHLSLSMMFPRPPLKYGPGPEIIALKAPDGVTVYARHWPNPAAKHTLLYLHGNYEDLGSLNDYIPAFVQAGYAVFAIDYRGYGLSGGTPDEGNLYADTQLGYNYMRTKLGLPADRIVPFGYSLGGGPAVELALKQPVAGLVLQGAFVSAYRVMTHIPVFPGDKFVNLRKMPELRCPVMVIHGTADGTVPFWHGRKLYEAATSRKAYLFVDGGPHSGLADFTGPRYAEELRKFTDSL